MDQMEIDDEIERMAEAYIKSMPPAVRTARSDALWNLHYGSGGGGTTYGFEEACEILSEWTETVEAVQFEIAFDEDTGESEYERVDGSREMIIREIMGSELARYVS